MVFLRVIGRRGIYCKVLGRDKSVTFWLVEKIKTLMRYKVLLRTLSGPDLLSLNQAYFSVQKRCPLSIVVFVFHSIHITFKWG